MYTCNYYLWFYQNSSAHCEGNVTYTATVSESSGTDSNTDILYYGQAVQFSHLHPYTNYCVTVEATNSEGLKENAKKCALTASASMTSVHFFNVVCPFFLFYHKLHIYPYSQSDKQTTWILSGFQLINGHSCINSNTLLSGQSYH